MFMFSCCQCEWFTNNSILFACCICRSYNFFLLYLYFGLVVLEIVSEANNQHDKFKILIRRKKLCACKYSMHNNVLCSLLRREGVFFFHFLASFFIFDVFLFFFLGLFGLVGGFWMFVCFLVQKLLEKWCW